MSFDDDGGFQRELENLLNRHSKENESGTPDFVLAQYLNGCLRLYNQAIRDRAEFRDEPVNKKPGTKKVPLVVYTEGRRNEIGEAEVEEWPGEVRVSGTIIGVMPIVNHGIGILEPAKEAKHE